MAKKTTEQHQKDIDKAVIDASIKFFNHPDRQKYIDAQIEKIPLVNGVHDPNKVNELYQLLIQQFGEKLPLYATTEYIKTDRDLLFKKFTPFNVTSEKQSERGKKGAREANPEWVSMAQKIIKDHPISKKSSGRKLQRHLNTHGLPCKKTWVYDHKEEIFS